MTAINNRRSGGIPDAGIASRLKAYLWVGSLLVAIWGVFAWFIAGHRFDSRATALVGHETQLAEQQADIVARNIDRDLDYLRGILSQLASDDGIRTALLRFGADISPSPLSGEQRKKRWSEDTSLGGLSNALALTGKHLGADMIWLMSASGDCIASSNAGQPESFVGTNYADRAYFLQARQGKAGRQYAVGRKTGVPGLFFSYPVTVEGRFVGVVAVKRDLPRLAFWVDQADAFVADEHGVIIIAHDTRLLMRALPGASVATLPETETLSRYKRKTFLPLRLRFWGEPRFPALRRLDHEQQPLVLATRNVANADIDVFVVRRLTDFVAFEQERNWLFLLLALAGTLLIATVSGTILYLRTNQHARRTLAAHKKRLDEAQRISHVGNWELDLVSGTLLWSDEIYRIFEIDPDRFGASYEAFLQRVHPEERDRVGRAYSASVKNRQPYEIIHRLLFPDGRIKYVQEHCETFYDKQGKPLRSAGTVQDVTERVAAEERTRLAAQEIEDLYEHAPCGYHSLDQNGIFIRINLTELEWLDYSRDEVIGKLRFTDLLAPGSLQTFADNFPRFKETGFVHDLEFEMLRKDGSTLWVLLNAAAIYDDEHRYVSNRSTVFDITERKGIERALRESEERFRDILEYAPIGMAVVSLEGRFLRVNQALCNIVGYTREALEQLTFQEITHPDDLDADLANAQSLLNGEIHTYQMEKRYLRNNGQAVWVQLTGSLLRDAMDAPQHFIAQIEDISERKERQEHFRQLAYYDPLTGLPNRRLLMDRLNLALAQARRYRRALAVMFMDLDRFKQINDTWGHDVGDELLRGVATRLEACVRSGDTVSRQGGDEFVIVLPEISHPQDAALVAENILAVLSEPILVQGHELRITTSIGIAIYPTDGPDDAMELMKKADTAMYAAKKAGRNGYRFHDHAPEAEA